MFINLKVQSIKYSVQSIKYKVQSTKQITLQIRLINIFMSL